MTQESQQEVVLIVEDVEEWRQHVATVVREIVGADTEIQFAKNATEAAALISTIDQTRQKLILVLSDIHMSQSAQSGDNGDALLSNLMQRKEPTPPFAFVSGTLVARYQRELASRIPGIIFLDKDAFLPMKAGTLDREALNKTLGQLLAQGNSNIPHDQVYLDMLQKMKDELLNVAGLDIFIDKIKARIGTIWGKYGEFFKSKGLAVDFLKTPDLYGTGVDPRKLHTFKNTLATFIDVLYRTEGTPPELLDELTGLQVYINQVWSRAGEDKQMDAVSGTLGVCRNFGTFRPGRIEFSSDVEKLDAAVGTVDGFFITVEALQNALSNSGEGKVKVHMNADGKLTIRNNALQALGFEIIDNEMNGNAPESSPSGSGKGLRMIIETAKRLGIKVNMRQEGDCVVTEIDYSGVKAAATVQDAEQTPAEPGASDGKPAPAAESKEVLPPLSNIAFVCRGGYPEMTFKGVQDNKIDGTNYHNIQYTRDLAWLRKIFEESKEILDNASLCVVHSGYGPLIEDIFPILRELYPHLVLLPASGDGDIFRGSIPDIAEYHRSTNKLDESEYANILIPSDIAPHLREGESIEEVSICLYEKSYPPKIWEILVRVATEIATEKRKKLMEAAAQPK
ncbi:MAG: hypothetical protein WCT53_03910 [Candidatus Gracilibacteria bacterium]